MTTVLALKLVLMAIGVVVLFAVGMAGLLLLIGGGFRMINIGNAPDLTGADLPDDEITDMRNFSEEYGTKSNQPQ